MTSLLYGAHEAVSWKVGIRQRVMQNLEDMLQDAHRAYLQKISENTYATAEVRQQLHTEYNQSVQALRYIAEEEVKAEIDREEEERDLMAQTNFDAPAEFDQEFVLEQAKMLATIRAQASVRPHAIAMDGDGPLNASSLFEQGSSSRPLDTSRQRSGSTTAATSVSSIVLKEDIPETSADREARVRREQHEQQQEDFRRRAEEIRERKRRQRIEKAEQGYATSDTSQESISCSSSNTSASDSDKVAPPRMSEEEVINLMIFHDQRWSWISSLSHLQWADFPWPCLTFSPPKSKDALTLEAVAEYIYAQYNIHRDRNVVKEHLKNLIKRWHPDRFEIKYLSRIADLHERDTVREGAGAVARILNDLLEKWNDVQD
ncbi:hypothetical protein CPB83DRAFT_809636 [Crepidotus variabilis]|uniref:Uncharacterized protein n=1 Tax=Crepidotus variabilis TaxID=179855 RepID=A0A9P6ELV9_9AGAR|nr:hypothetical protein CPB83DRAFT_809636 [Crepidotus variabilis]